MEEIKIHFGEDGRGTVKIYGAGEELGEMELAVAGADLTVYHTEVAPKAEGKGLAKQMLDTVVEHARTNNLKIIPLCQYVHAQFKRHKSEYADVWGADETG